MSSTSYVPDDARVGLSSLEFLRTGEGQVLRGEVAALLQSELSVSAVAGLRKKHPVDAVHAALTLGQIQKKALQKFPTFSYFWATPEALEQATSARVAAHKATRYAAAGAQRIIDCCCGIGGDSLSLANVGITFAIDQSEVRLCCLRFNAEDHPPAHPLRTITGKIENVLEKHSPLPLDAFVHIDPSRRTDGKRSALYEDLMPGPEVLEKLFERYPDAGLKLSSAADFESLPEGHLELISENGCVVQAMLWRNKLAGIFPEGTRTATVLSDDTPTFIFTARPAHGWESLGAGPGAYLYEVDGSITRAGLAKPFAETLSLVPLTVDGGYLTSDELHTHAALTAFRVHATVPFSEQRVSDALLAVDAPAGAVEVKSRGGPAGVETDSLQKVWSKKANRRLTVLLYRRGDETFAAIATRV